MKTLLLIPLTASAMLSFSPAQEETPPEGEHPLHTNAKGFAKRSASEAAAALAKGDRKSALEAYQAAISHIPEVDALKKEYYLYRARFTALALQLAADALETDDEASARAYLGQILAPDMDPGNGIANNLLQSIDPKPTVAEVPATPVVPVTPPSAPDADTDWNHELGDSLPDINREWGFLLFKDVDTGILKDGDIIELVREDTVLATFKATIPDDQEDALVLGVKGSSPIPANLRKGDNFRLKSD